MEDEGVRVEIYKMLAAECNNTGMAAEQHPLLWAESIRCGSMMLFKSRLLKPKAVTCGQTLSAQQLESRLMLAALATPNLQFH